MNIIIYIYNTFNVHIRKWHNTFHGDQRVSTLQFLQCFVLNPHIQTTFRLYWNEIHIEHSSMLVVHINLKGVTEVQTPPCPIWMSHVISEWVKSHMNQVTYYMGWLRLVGSLKLYVSFAKEPYKRDYILQKRLVILRSQLMSHGTQVVTCVCHDSFHFCVCHDSSHSCVCHMLYVPWLMTHQTQVYVPYALVCHDSWLIKHKCMCHMH